MRIEIGKARVPPAVYLVQFLVHRSIRVDVASSRIELTFTLHHGHGKNSARRCRVVDFGHQIRRTMQHRRQKDYLCEHMSLLSMSEKQGAGVEPATIDLQSVGLPLAYPC